LYGDREEAGAGQLDSGRRAKSGTPQIDSVVLIDRATDLLTPMVTQLTYEGLIDELFGVNNSECSQIRVDNFFFSLLWP
jgi:hypothetical protein